MSEFVNESVSTNGTEKSGSSIASFTNTFVLSTTSDAKQVLCEVPKGLNIDHSRQRRAHQKSRAGCDSCKQRRVKCNEETTCANCIQRGDHCQRLAQYNRGGVTSVPRTPLDQILLSSSSASANNVVNLLHLKLFHHFQTSTYHTLFFEADGWAHVIQLSFNFDFLMNAILCVAARHLAFLCPEIPTYVAAAASHLAQALAGFRVELSNELASKHLDVFIATSMLLQFEIWTNVDLISPRDDNVTAFDPSKDNIFAFNSSLKEVFLGSFPATSIQNSVFGPYHRNSPLNTLVEAAQISSDTLARFQDFFDYDRPLTPDLLNVPLPYIRDRNQANSDAWAPRVPNTQDTPDPIQDGYAPVITRLCLILSFLPEAHPPCSLDAKLPLLLGLARYIHSFPVMCHGPFASMVYCSNPHALLLLYHFYRAVGILLSSDEYWWAHKRATILERELKEWLTARCS